MIATSVVLLNAGVRCHGHKTLAPGLHGGAVEDGCDRGEDRVSWLVHRFAWPNIEAYLYTNTTVQKPSGY